MVFYPVKFGRLAFALFLAATPILAQRYQGQDLVQADALAAATAIVPGRPILVGVRLHMAKGWHTYWKYPGDAGIPTEIQWQLPAGWQAGPIQWPAPLKLDEPGDIQIYGYHDTVLLMQELTPPSNWTAASVEVTAKVNWLVCEKICIPGDATVSLKLGDPGATENTGLIAQFQAQLPKVAPASLRWHWSADAKGLLLQVEGSELAKAGEVDFYPSPAENVAVAHPKLESRQDDRFVFRVPLDAGNRNYDSLPGLIVASAPGQERHAWEIGTTAGPVVAAKPGAPASGGLLRFLLFGFIGGFILNLMPCVLPVISLKIFGFVQQAGQDRTRILRSGLAFVAGIFVWFVGLALILIALKSGGREITWAFQFTNPYFVLVMSAVVLVFALNLFGVFEINLPQWLNRGAAATASTHGDAGSFFQGVFATILATPCTAPFLGTALGFAFTQSATVILLMFLAIAAGMSAPYLFLSAQPAWVRFLPKPGDWMTRVKQFMGFLLLATLLFLLSVLGAQRGVNALIWTSAFLLVLSIACWLKGAFLTPLASASTRFATWLVMLVLVGAGASYFIGSKFVAAEAPANELAASADWEKFSPDRLARALAEGRPTFIDFTAAWCITCKFNESTVLETADVRTAFSQRKILKLKADWTNGDPEITKLLKQFGRPGVPLYVLYPGKTVQPVIFPELLTKNIVLEKLETVNNPVASR